MNTFTHSKTGNTIGIPSGFSFVSGLLGFVYPLIRGFFIASVQTFLVSWVSLVLILIFLNCLDVNLENSITLFIIFEFCFNAYLVPLLMNDRLEKTGWIKIKGDKNHE